MRKQCLNPRCDEVINVAGGPSGEIVCPSCRYAGRAGMFAGGVILGIIIAIIKLVH